MRSLTMFSALLAASIAAGSLGHAQSTEPTSKTGGSASEEEVNQLRIEVTAQRKTIEELKTLVEKLVDAKTEATGYNPVAIRPAAAPATAEIPAEEINALPVSAPDGGTAHLVKTVLVQPDPVIEAAMLDQPGAAAPRKEPPLTAGWNGEHFFIRSADGQFSISPYGYVNTDYRVYNGDGVPPNTFLLRNARFGFQGNYGNHFDFALLIDAASTTGSVVRDVYLNVRIRPELQFQAGQFKAPFAQETGIGDTNLDFIERGFQSMLYPSAASAYRSPGVALHGRE